MTSKATLTISEIATKRGVSNERARQIARSLGAKKGKDNTYMVDADKFAKWEETAVSRSRSKTRRPKKASAKKTVMSRAAAAPTPSAPLNGVTSLVLDVLTDRQLDDKTARNFATYLVKKAG